jgi:hypothetical protein
MFVMHYWHVPESGWSLWSREYTASSVALPIELPQLCRVSLYKNYKLYISHNENNITIVGISDITYSGMRGMRGRSRSGFAQ